MRSDLEFTKFAAHLMVLGIQKRVVSWLESQTKRETAAVSSSTRSVAEDLHDTEVEI